MNKRTGCITLLLCLLFFMPLHSFGFVFRNQGDMYLGVIGGYGFPQIDYFKDSSNNTLHQNNGKEYYMGLDFGYFVTNSLAIHVELDYNYDKIVSDGSNGDLKFIQRYAAFNVQAQYYWFEFLYLGAGFFGKFPWGSSGESNLSDLKGKSLITGGAIVEFGINMRFWDPFSLRVGVRITLPFTPYLSQEENNYKLYSFPVDFVIGLEWVF